MTARYLKDKIDNTSDVECLARPEDDNYTVKYQNVEQLIRELDVAYEERRQLLDLLMQVGPAERQQMRHEIRIWEKRIAVVEAAILERIPKEKEEFNKKFDEVQKEIREYTFEKHWNEVMASVERRAEMNGQKSILAEIGKLGPGGVRKPTLTESIMLERSVSGGPKFAGVDKFAINTASKSTQFHRPNVEQHNTEGLAEEQESVKELLARVRARVSAEVDACYSKPDSCIQEIPKQKKTKSTWGYIKDKTSALTNFLGIGNTDSRVGNEASARVRTTDRPSGSLLSDFQNDYELGPFEEHASPPIPRNEMSSLSYFGSENLVRSMMDLSGKSEDMSQNDLPIVKGPRMYLTKREERSIPPDESSVRSPTGEAPTKGWFQAHPVLLGSGISITLLPLMSWTLWSLFKGSNSRKGHSRAHGRDWNFTTESYNS